jgi:hypothetical protein
MAVLREMFSRLAQSAGAFLKPGATAPERTDARDREVTQLRRRLAATQAELSEARAELARRSSDRDTPVFFIVGQSKSGTGWLTQILDNHPEILCRGGGRFFGRELRHEEFKGSGTRIQPSSLYNAIVEAEYLRLWIERSVWTRGDDPEEHLIRITRLAIEHFLEEKLSTTGKRMVGDKTPLHTQSILGEMAAIYPEAKVIHIIRDGRDQAVSRMHHVWKSEARGGVATPEPEELAKREAFYRDPQRFLASGQGIFVEERLRLLAEEWGTRVGKTVEDGPSLLGSNYAEVRYEDLLERPEEETKRLLEFLATDGSREVVGRCVEAANFEKMAGRERGRENYALDHGKHRKGIAGDWKNVFTEQDKAIFKEAAGDLLIELGYERDDRW